VALMATDGYLSDFPWDHVEGACGGG
jgi:hypothetical protein